jgi:hypothetical protein
MTPDELTLRIVLERPPEGVDFGIQKGRGSGYETILRQRSAGGDLSFEISVQVKAGGDFGGPIVQGPRGGRFVYVDIGTYAGQTGTQWSRRLKIPLSGITPAMIRAGKVLEARVAGTGKDGGPTCGTATQFNGWRPA